MWVMFVVPTPLSYLLRLCSILTKVISAGSVKCFSNVFAQGLPSSLVSLLLFNSIRLASMPNKLASNMESKGTTFTGFLKLVMSCKMTDLLLPPAERRVIASGASEFLFRGSWWSIAVARKHPGYSVKMTAGICDNRAVLLEKLVRCTTMGGQRIAQL